MYLKHFNLSKEPFTLTPNTDFFCQMPTHQEALNVLLLCLSQGEGFIKIVGEVGTGKTLLCRILLKSLSDDYLTAYIPNPDQSADSLRFSLAFELGIKVDTEWTQYQLLEAINNRLLALYAMGKKTVLIIDEAQALPEACLEALRLLTNLETEERKLLQVVLFAQPEINAKLNTMSLRQLKQRITFSYHLRPLTRDEMDKYLTHRLARAGYTYGCPFTVAACKHLYRASKGLPRLLNILGHKSLLVAYGQGKIKVDKSAVRRAIADTESSAVFNWKESLLTYLGIGAPCISVLFMLYWKYGLIL